MGELKCVFLPQQQNRNAKIIVYKRFIVLVMEYYIVLSVCADKVGSCADKVGT